MYRTWVAAAVAALLWLLLQVGCVLYGIDVSRLRELEFLSASAFVVFISQFA